MRPKTTGNYKTRADLVEKVRFLYFETNCSLERIGRHVGVSQMTVSKIIESKEWEHLSDFDHCPPQKKTYATKPKGKHDRPLTHAELQERKQWEAGEKNARGATCGHGYIPAACPVHLPARTLRELETVEPLYRTDEWWKGL